MRFTEKYVRTDSQWVKITRDNKKRSFTFARGYKGELSARDMSSLSFRWIANWKEAIDRANSLMTYV